MQSTDPSLENDPRWAIFRAAHGPEVFHSIVSPRDVWRTDPFDVEEIHTRAREVFAHELARTAAEGGDQARGQQSAGQMGKILLLRGESGAGKTHLMRAFRHHVHAKRLGWFAYLQMTANTTNYFRYVLDNVLDSLSEPYDLEGGAAESGLQRLSNALAEHPAAPAAKVAALREAEHANVTQLVVDIAEDLLDQPAFTRGRADQNVLRALLYLQRCEPAFARRVGAYLRCEAMARYDSELLGEIPPRSGEDEPAKMLAALGRLMALAAPAGGAFVLCLDQLEDAWQPGEEAKIRFVNAMKAVRAIAEPNPAALVVASCLDDYWIKLRELLDKPLRDRFEQEAPEPVILRTRREPVQVEAMIARRLAFLYEDAGVAFRPEEPLFPFARAEVAALTPLRARDILLACRRAREQSVLSGAWPRLSEPGTPLIAPPADLTAQTMEGGWNDFRSAFAAKPPEEDLALSELLAWAINEMNAELAADCRFEAAAQHRFIEVSAPAELALADNAPHRWLVALCNGKTQGGHLSRQIAELMQAAAGASRAAVAVRAAAYPASPRAKVVQQIGELVKTGGRRVVVDDADWRVILTLRAFLQEATDAAALSAWRAVEKPLSRLASLRAVLLLDKLPAAAENATPAETKSSKDSATSSQRDPLSDAARNGSGQAKKEKTSNPPVSAEETGPLSLGVTREIAPRPVGLPPDNLVRHATFLGGSGSGKTTLALALIESLLLRGIPAILLDRKGDLACYAQPESWNPPLPVANGHAADAEARRARLREKLDVQLFTPGDAAAGRGRPLGISLLPRGVGALSGLEREAVVRSASASLGAMLNYKSNGATASRLTILGKAIGVLAELEPDVELTLKRVIDLIASEDARLVGNIGHLETKQFKKVVADLENFSYHQGWMLAADDEPRVDAERLFGFGAHAPAAGKTRLSIISTKFFTDTPGALFWIAQFLLEISRYAARRPATKLQAVVLFDEADLYLPATGKIPPTKEPMENALRRWRSAGLGVLLASQSPGDFDYKCRDNIRHWLVGRVQQDTAIAKMKPMLHEAKTDIGTKLPGLGAGQFYLVRDGQVESLQARRSLVTAEQIPDDEILRLAAAGG